MSSWRVLASLAPSNFEGQRTDRLAAQLTQAGLAATAVLMGVAMWLYPGGTWAQREGFGYAFWENFWCDLLRAQALNGLPNPLAPQLATLAMLTFALALATHWVTLARRLESSSLGRWVRRFGLVSSVGIVLVALMPSDRFPTGHPLAVLTMGPALLGAIVASCMGTWRQHGRLRMGLSLVGLGVLLGILNLIQYARQVLHLAEYALWLPGVQKAATLCFVAWVVLVSTSPPKPQSHLTS